MEGNSDPGPFDSVSPLPQDVRHSLVAMICIGMASLLTTTLLLVQITYSLVRWKLRDLRRQRLQDQERARSTGLSPAGPDVDLQLGLTEEHYYLYQATRGKPGLSSSGGGEFNSNNTKYASTQREQEEELERTETALSSPTEPTPAARPCPVPHHAGGNGRRRGREKPPNPLLLLIYNLLLADAALSAAYANDAVWLAMDAIVAPSPTCNAQGWIISFGCLTTSGFLFTISVFSYLGIIRGYKATQRDVLVACSTVWTMSIVLSTVGPISFHGDGSFYGRETNWVRLLPRVCKPHHHPTCPPDTAPLTTSTSQCWISEKHKLWRLTVYLWGLPLLTAAGCIYGLIFYRLWQEGRSSRFMPRRRAGSSTTDVSSGAPAPPRPDACNNNNIISSSTPLRPSGHHPAFLIYPCIYMVTGTPLMLGSLVPVLERSPAFMGAAGALLASTGLLDTILWSSIVLFSRKEDLRYTGLDQFAFMRTPEGRTLGNIVFVQGGSGGNSNRALDAAAAAAAEGGGAAAAAAGARKNNHHRQSWHSRKKPQDKGWWRLGDKQSDQASISQERLPDASDGIQMEVVTSVVVERGVPDGYHSRNFSREEAKSMESM